MKTIEQKAKAYDKAVEKLRDFYRDYDTVSLLIDVKEELEHIFPELKESEDEKIRKRLIHIVKASKAVCDEIGYNQETILDWLEKQKPIELDKDAEIRFKSILNLIDNGCPIKKSYIDFIKSVYAMLMKSQQWSEEDEKKLSDLCDILYYESLLSEKETKEYCDWLESLKDRYAKSE